MVGRTQLLDLGLTPAAIDSRVSRGQLVQVRRRVYRLGPAPLTSRGLISAAVRACVSPVLVSYDTAAGLWELAPLRTDVVHVTLVHGRGKTRPGVVVHRSRTLVDEDWAERDGLPTTSLARTLVDIATWDRRRLERAIEEADRNPEFSVAETLAACDRAYGRPGIRRLRALLEQWTVPEPTEGELGRRFRELCHEQLPADRQPSMEHRWRRWRLDAFWPESSLAVELDGVEWHARPGQMRRDHEKNLALAEAGIDLIRLGWPQITSQAATTGGMLRRRLLRAGR